MVECPDLVCCPMADRITRLEDWQKQSENFHERTEKFQEDSTKSSIRMEEKLGTVCEDVKKLVSWHDSEQSKPQRRIDSIVDNLVWLVIAAFAGYILGQLGLG